MGKKLQEIIYDVIKDQSHLWVRHFVTEKQNGFTSPGEYVELRGRFITDKTLSELLQGGFKIKSITTIQINADVYSDVLFRRELTVSE